MPQNFVKYTEEVEEITEEKIDNSGKKVLDCDELHSKESIVENKI